MTSWRPPIALTFSRDTAYPTHAERFRALRLTRLPEALYFVSWVIEHRCRLQVHFVESKVYFIGDYTFLRGTEEVIDWLSQKIGRSFIDYAADLFVELCEKRKAVCDTRPEFEGQIMFFPDKKVHLCGIDFENQIIKIARTKAGPLNVVSYPAEEALEMLDIDWHTLRRTFGVAYLATYRKQELISALNKLSKDEVIIKVWIEVIQGQAGTIYKGGVMTANPNNIALRVKLDLEPPLKESLSRCQIASDKGGLTMLNLDTALYKMLYIPAEQKVIFHYLSPNPPMQSKILVELKVEPKNLRVMWDQDAWILLASWRNYKDDFFEELKISEQGVSEQDFYRLISNLRLRFGGNKHI